MLLPNAEQAFVNIEKLTRYCLDSDHPRGKHKARVFAAALGMTADDGPTLRGMLLEAAKTQPAVEGQIDAYGCRYMVELAVETSDRQVVIRSFWIVRSGEHFARLTSCYVV